MRREGRQHGMVRTYPILAAPFNPRPKPRTLNELSSTPTAGLFNKVSTKPTNHSKFTGKCGRSMCRDCHVHPACKSKDKVKGSRKVRSMSQSGLITWRVVDTKPGLKITGFSASSMLDYLDEDCLDRHDDNEDDEVEGVYYGNDVLVVPSTVEIKEVNDDCDVNDGDNDDQMSFCEVGFALDEDESWCLVEEL